MTPGVTPGVTPGAGAGGGNVGTGFLYDGGAVPICCSPEYLAAYGVGLDSTYGDGIVQGVLREDQAESAFMSMFPDQYTAVEGAAGQLETLTNDIKTFALGLEPGTNLFDIVKEIRDNEDGQELSEDATAFKAIVDQIETTIAGNPELEAMIGNFFGAASVEEEGGIGLMMASTVLMGYDVHNGDDGGDGANGRDGVSLDAEDITQLQNGSQPRVSLGEIVQWSMESNAYMSLYSTGKNGDESLADFTQRAFTAVSEGDQAGIQAISTASGYTPEQIQVLVSVMMNNHSNLMSTTGNFANSGKNGAHEYLNDMDGGNRAFNMLHIGNLGTTDDLTEDGLVDDNDGNANAANDGNENLNNVVGDIASGDANSIFYAGDNGQGANGGFDDLTADQDYIAGYGATNPMSAATAVDPTASSLFADPLVKSELLGGLSAMGAGFIGGNTPPVEVQIGGETVTASIEQSEDFENEGYDVVIINLTDANGNSVGSMTATEAMGADGQPELVEYADNNGDGIVDAVDEGGLSTEIFEENTTGNMAANGSSTLTYNDADSEAGSGMVADYGAGAATGLAMNEAFDGTEWRAIDGYGAQGVTTVAAGAAGIQATPGAGMAEEADPAAGAAGADPEEPVDGVEEEAAGEEADAAEETGVEEEATPAAAAPAAATPAAATPAAATPAAATPAVPGTVTPAVPGTATTATEADAGPVTDGTGAAGDPFAGMTAQMGDVFDGTLVNFIGASTTLTSTEGGVPGAAMTPTEAGMPGSTAGTPVPVTTLPVGSAAADAAAGDPNTVVTTSASGGFIVNGVEYDAMGNPVAATPAVATPAAATPAAATPATTPTIAGATTTPMV